MIERLRGMISCEEALSHLWELIDGELAPGDEMAVRRHVEVCSRCFPRYDFQRAYLALLRRIRRGEGPSPDLRRRLARLIPGAPSEEGHAPGCGPDTSPEEEA